MLPPGVVSCSPGSRVEPPPKQSRPSDRQRLPETTPCTPLDQRTAPHGACVTSSRSVVLGAGLNWDSTVIRPRHDHSTTYVTTAWRIEIRCRPAIAKVRYGIELGLGLAHLRYGGPKPRNSLLLLIIIGVVVVIMIVIIYVVYIALKCSKRGDNTIGCVWAAA